MPCRDKSEVGKGRPLFGRARIEGVSGLFAFQIAVRIVIEYLARSGKTAQMTDNANQKKPLEGKIWGFSFVAWCCVISGAILTIPGLRLLFTPDKPIALSDLSNFGSYLQGAVQSLWTLASFLFIYVAFLGQKQQMQLQSDQFALEQKKQEEQAKEQQAELQRQVEQFKLQQEGIRRQNFEASLFQLLNLHNQIVSDITFQVTGGDNPVIRHGRRSFEALYGRLHGTMLDAIDRNSYTQMRIAKDATFQWSEREYAIAVYEDFYDRFQGRLGHYFRTLYHIFKFIKESGYDYKTQRRYTSLVRAQLSAFELALLFYNGITPLGEKFKPLIEEFGLLENFEKSLLPAGSFDHQLFYDQKAYQ